MFNFEINIPILLSLLGAAVSGLYGYWNLQKAADDATKENIKIHAEIETRNTATNSRIDKVESSVENIQKSGTDYGRSAYSTQAVERAQMKKDLEENQSAIRSLLPVVTEIGANVKWLMHANGADTPPGPDIPILRHSKPPQSSKSKLNPKKYAYTPVP